MEFIYKAIPVERLQVPENWTKEDEAVIDKHYEYLLHLKQQNKLLLAGKTDGMDETTYGIVIFKANDFNEALTIMNNDPAIKHNVLAGTLHKYGVAIHNKDYKKDE